MFRKGIPKPFQRNSINLDRAVKEWQHVAPESLDPGDVVADFGQVAGIQHNEYPAEWTILTNINGVRSVAYKPGETVFAFTQKRTND